MNRLVMICALWILATATIVFAAADLELEEIARIGEFEGSREYMFGSIAYGGVLSDGSVVIHDRQMHEIRCYAPDGGYLGTIGSEGEGPGEFIDVRGLMVTPDDKVVALSRPSMVTIYDGQSRAYETSFSTPGQLHAPQMLACDRDGRIYVRSMQKRPEGTDEWCFEWHVYDREGQLVGKVAIPLQRPSHKAFVLMRSEGPRFSFPVRTESTVGLDGHLMEGRSDAYDIVTSGADSSVRFRREIDRIRIGDGERDRYLEFAKRFETEKFTMPEYKPYFRSLYAGPGGSVWVERYAAAEADTVMPEDDSDSYVDWHEPNVYDIFATNGAHQGTVRVPGLARVIGFRANDLWGVDSTDRGEQLVHWKIVRR